MRILALLGLLLAASAAQAQTPNVGSCPTAIPGAVWAANSFQPCSTTPLYIAQPVSATAIISDMRCTAAGVCTFTWQTASNVLATDQVWTGTPTTGTWAKASTINGPWNTPNPPTNVTVAHLSWTPSTLDTTGKALTSQVTYSVWKGSTPTTVTNLVTTTTALAATDSITSSVPVTVYYSVSANCAVNCLDSAKTTPTGFNVVPAQPAKITPLAPGPVAATT